MFPNIYENDERLNQDRVRQGDVISTDYIKNKFLKPQTVVGWMVINAECDLDNENKINWLNFACVRPVEYFLFSILQGYQNLPSSPSNSMRNKLKNLIKQEYGHMYFLPQNEPHVGEFGAYVDLGLIVSRPVYINENDKNISTILELVDHRLFSLKETWRTELAQHYSLYFGRHGTPDHDKDKFNEWANENIQNVLNNFVEIQSIFS